MEKHEWKHGIPDIWNQVVVSNSAVGDNYSTTRRTESTYPKNSVIISDHVFMVVNLHYIF